MGTTTGAGVKGLELRKIFGEEDTVLSSSRGLWNRGKNINCKKYSSPTNIVDLPTPLTNLGPKIVGGQVPPNFYGLSH